MSRQLADLQTVLNQLIGEHRKLLRQLETQHEAMKTLNVNGIEEAIHLQEATRGRISAIENRRKQLMVQIGASLRQNGNITLKQLAELLPPQAPALMALRSELTDVMKQISQRTYMASRLSSAVLGHVNLALRLLAKAVERAGIYTREGVPQIKSRIGVMDAMG